MLKRHIGCIVFIILWIGVTSSLAQDAPVLFEANFDDGTIPESLHIQYGTQSISDGILSYSVDNGGFLVIPDGITWTDYAVEARLRITSGSVWLQARTGSDLCSGYYLTVNLTRDLYDLSMANADCDFSVFESWESAGVPSDWLTARIEVNGNQITTYVDGDLLFTATDDNYTVGYPTINIFSGDDDHAQVDFDTIRVMDLSALPMSTDITPTDETTPTVDASPTEASPTAEATVEVTPTETESVELPDVSEIPIHDEPTDIIKNLQEQGLIPTGVGELYQDNGIAISRVGAWFEPVFEGVETRNIVMSGDIRFLPYDNTESCLLSVRIERDAVGVAQRFLDVGINSRLEVSIGETDDHGAYNQAAQEGLLTQPDGNILLVAFGNRLSVFLDGRAVFQNVEVTPREGTLGVSAISSTSFTVCHVTNIWAYTFDD